MQPVNCFSINYLHSTFFFFFYYINLYNVCTLKKVVIQRNTFCKGIHINWFQNICLNWRNSDLEFFVFKIQFHTSQSARSAQKFYWSYYKIVNFRADTSFSWPNERVKIQILVAWTEEQSFKTCTRRFVW